jgi:hypothetical protein
VVPTDKQRSFTPRLSVSVCNKLIGIDHVVTCAPADIKDLFGDIIRTEPFSKIKEKLKGGATIVKFSDPGGQIHYLPCDKCQTWFVR